ncbi:MAG TPA: ABC transporter ATP-binding protein [Acidimicrobiales bacterium]|nr:ABC transporter ATP-binding protein [Acidimicrobiales bacterium]
MADIVLHCESLSKRFGSQLAVDDLSFEVAAGECYGLLGPNGAGKTTTISIVCGLLQPDTGTVVVDGQAMSAKAVAARAAIGYVPQEVALYAALTAQENLVFFGRLYGLGGRRLAERVSWALELVGLVDRARDKIETYSGGMKRRANIAAGLLHEPQLLVLDEPTVGIDPQSRHAILDTVAALAQSGMAVVYASHYMEEVERLCDRVGILDRGRLVAEGTRAELVEMVAQGGHIDLGIRGALPQLATAYRRLRQVEEVTVGDQGVRVVGRHISRLLPKLLETAQASGSTVLSVDVAEPDLETVFLHLTGRALRD